MQLQEFDRFETMADLVADTVKDDPTATNELLGIITMTLVSILTNVEEIKVMILASNEEAIREGVQ